jgi:hypothetical protein
MPASDSEPVKHGNLETTLTETPVQPEEQPRAPAFIRLDEVRWKLAKLWLIMSTVFVFLLIGQSVMNKYAGKVTDVWSWALPTIIPTLSLILTVLGATSNETSKDDQARIKKPFYRAVYWISMFYLSLILGTVLVEPFTPYAPLELFKLSNLWLGPIQGLVASSMAALFFTKKAKS